MRSTRPPYGVSGVRYDWQQAARTCKLLSGSIRCTGPLVASGNGASADAPAASTPTDRLPTGNTPKLAKN